MRSILRPAFSASSRHRCSSFSNALSSTASFFNGWRSMPGTIPATSQLEKAHLNDRNQRAVRLEGGEGSAQVVQLLHGVAPSVHISDDGMQYPRRRPIASSIIDIGADKITATFAADLRAAIQPKVCSNMKETLGWSGFRLT